MKSKLLEVESALVHINKLRDKEYAFAWKRKITEHGIYVWPATGNHTVWREIIFFAYGFDEYAHPVYLDEEKELVFEIGIY